MLHEKCYKNTHKNMFLWQRGLIWENKLLIQPNMLETNLKKPRQYNVLASVVASPDFGGHDSTLVATSFPQVSSPYLPFPKA